MARKQTSADLQAQIAKLMEQQREAIRREKVEAKQAEEKLALKLGRMVLEYQKNWFTGFNKTDFIKTVNDLVAGSGAAPAPVTEATDEASAEVNDAPIADVADALVSGAANIATDLADSDTGTLAGTDTAETTDTAATEEAAPKRFSWGN